MTTLREITDNSALVVAHPDDEILWFSSIVKNVDRIVFCFSEAVGNSVYSEGRKLVLRDFPHKQVSTLDIKEGDVFDLADWKHPQPSVDGLEFRRTDVRRRVRRFTCRISVICAALREVLKGYRNVITHNPWGEYGHEEHVQVYRP